MRNLVFVFFAFFMVTSLAKAEAVSLFYPRQLLKDHKFEQFEALMVRANEGYLAGDVSYRDYYWATRSVWKKDDISKKWLEEALLSWVSSSPESAYAFILLGHYYGQKAFNARGARWAKDTSAAHFKRMETLFAPAIAALGKGLKRDPDIILGHTQMLEIAKASRKELEIRPAEYFAAIPDRVKKETAIWSDFLSSLVPRWGGSYAQIQNTIHRLVRTGTPSVTRAEIQTLADVITYDKMLIAVAKDDYKSALDLAKESIAADTGHAGIYQLASNAAQQVKDYKLCYRYAGVAVQMRPSRAEGWLRRGVCAVKLKKWAEATEAFQHRLHINGLSDYDVFQLGVSHMYHHDYRKAYAFLKQSEKLNRSYRRYTERYVSYIEKDQQESMDLAGVNPLSILADVLYIPDTMSVD